MHDMPVGTDDCARLAVIQHGAPRVLARPENLSLGDGDSAGAEPAGERFTVGFDAQHRSHCVTITDQHIRLACEGLDEGTRVAAAPQRFAVVEIEADRHALCARSGERGGQSCHRPVPQRRRDPGCMEPARAFQDLGPVDVAGIDLSQRRTSAIVYHAHRAQIGAWLDKVQPQPRATAHDPIGPHALSLQRFERRIAEGACGETRDVVGPHAEVAERDGDVGLRAAEECLQRRRLEQPLLARRTEPELHLAERDHPFQSRAPATA